MTFENLKALVSAEDFGWYCLTDLSGTNTFALYSTDDVKEKTTSAEIINALEQKMELIGAGNYKLLLKKSPQTKAQGTVTFKFTHGDPVADSTYMNPAHLPRNLNGLGGLTLDEVDARVARAVTEAVERERQFHALEKQKDEIGRMLEDFKKEKNRPGKNNEALTELAGMGKILLAGAVAKWMPESVTMINGMIRGTTDDSTDEKI